MNYIIVIILVIMSGIFSGLTLGYFSLDLADLERKINMGNQYAKKVYPIRKKGNLLLCTLLLGNVAINSAMAVFLGSIATGLVAGLISTGLIVIFGEIIPQASFSRHALLVGARMAWFVRGIIAILYPITFAIAWTLDKILGEELPTIWSKRELKEIIKQSEDSKRSNLDADEERIMLGALDYSNKTVRDVMIDSQNVFTINHDHLVDNKLLKEIFKKAYSRIPVLSNDGKVLGVIFAKDLLLYSVEDQKNASQLVRKKNFIVLDENQKLDDVLNKFISSKTIFGIINNLNIFKGIITLEDILEEIMQQNFHDEDDYVV